MRQFAFAAARKYFVIAILIAAVWLTSFVASYLLPAAAIALVACLLFLAAGMTCPKPLKSIDPEPSSESPPSGNDMPAVSTIRERGGLHPSRN